LPPAAKMKGVNYLRCNLKGLLYGRYDIQKNNKGREFCNSLPGHKWQCQAVKMKVINTIKWGLMKTKSTRHAKFVRDQTGKKCSMSIAVIKKNNSHNFNSI
jgi:hypothetical protein